jgi:hypothetical protein
VAPGIFAQPGRCWRFVYEKPSGHGLDWATRNTRLTPNTAPAISGGSQQTAVAKAVGAGSLQTRRVWCAASTTRPLTEALASAEIGPRCLNDHGLPGFPKRPTGGHPAAWGMYRAGGMVAGDYVRKWSWYVRGVSQEP